jgi:glycosyltransferase involved in cell wall biosynthesis
MRVLHVVKTSDGANWAAEQAAELAGHGVDVHVALPSLDGRQVRAWTESQATIHVAALDAPVRAPWRVPNVLQTARDLVARVKPDLIHSHFVGTTLVLRLALGKKHPIPRIFQVPGPLHLEHALYRRGELATAGPQDYWIATSRHIGRLYRQRGVAADRIFLSYSGTRHVRLASDGARRLRSRLGIPADHWVVGNANIMYPPKYHLAQTIGLKCHEDVIDALGQIIRSRPYVEGVLIGGQWGGRHGYEARLRARAQRAGQGRIHMPGLVPNADVPGLWEDFDLAVHVPLSENCGGVVEPFRAGVPVIASRVGGLPEVVIDGVTGVIVPARSPDLLAAAIGEAIDNPARHRGMAAVGRALVESMFDVRRTAAEVHAVYRHLLEHGPRPAAFDPQQAIVDGGRERGEAHARPRHDGGIPGGNGYPWRAPELESAGGPADGESAHGPHATPGPPGRSP